MSITRDFAETILQRPILNMLLDIIEKKSAVKNPEIDEVLNLREKKIAVSHQTTADQISLPFGLFDRVAYQSIQKQRKVIQELSNSGRVKEIDDDQTSKTAVQTAPLWISTPSRAFLRLLLGKKMYVEGDDVQNLRNFIKLFYPASKSSKDNPFWREGFEEGLPILADFLNFEEQEYKKGNLIGYHGLKGEFLFFYKYISAINSILTGRNISNSSLGMRNNQMAFINPQTGKPFTSMDEIFSLHSKSGQKNDTHYGKEHETMILFVNNLLPLGGARYPNSFSNAGTSSMKLFFENESVGFDSFQNWMMETLILLGMSPAYADQCTNELNSLYTQFFGMQKDNGGMLAVSIPQSLTSTHTFLGDIDDTITLTSKSVPEMYANILAECQKNEEELAQIDADLQKIEKKLSGEIPHPDETDEELMLSKERKLKEKEEKSGNFLERDSAYRERIKNLTIAGRIYLDPMQNFEIKGNWHYPLNPQAQNLLDNMLKNLVDIHALRFLRSNSRGMDNVFITPNPSKSLRNQFQNNYALQLARPLNVPPLKSDIFGYLISHEYRDVITELLQTRQLSLDITNPTFHNNFLKSTIHNRQFQLIGWLENLKEYISNFNWDTLITDKDREYALAYISDDPSAFYSIFFNNYHAENDFDAKDILAILSLFMKNSDFRPLIKDGLKDRLKGYYSDDTIPHDIETAIRVLHAHELESIPSEEQSEFIQTKLKEYLPTDSTSAPEEANEPESDIHSEIHEEEENASHYEASATEREEDDFKELFDESGYLISYYKAVDCLKTLYEQSPDQQFPKLLKRLKDSLFELVFFYDTEFELLNIPEIKEEMKKQMIGSCFCNVLDRLNLEATIEVVNKCFGSLENFCNAVVETRDFDKLSEVILNIRDIQIAKSILRNPEISEKLKQHWIDNPYRILKLLKSANNLKEFIYAQRLLQQLFGSFEEFINQQDHNFNYQLGSFILESQNLPLVNSILKNPEISGKLKDSFVTSPESLLYYPSNNAQLIIQELFGSIDQFYQVIKEQSSEADLYCHIFNLHNKEFAEIMLSDPKISENLKHHLITCPISQSELQAQLPFGSEDTLEDSASSSSSSSSSSSAEQSTTINIDRFLISKLFSNIDEYGKQVAIFQESEQFMQEKIYTLPYQERANSFIVLYNSDREKFYTMLNLNSEFLYIITESAYSLQNLFDTISKDPKIWNAISEYIQSDPNRSTLGYTSQHSPLFAQKLYENLGAEKFSTILKENKMLSEGLIWTLLDSQDLLPWMQEVMKNPELMQFIRTKLFQSNYSIHHIIDSPHIKLLGNTKEEFVENLKNPNLTPQNLLEIVSSHGSRYQKYIEAALADPEIWEKIKQYILQSPQEELSYWKHSTKIVEKLYNESKEEFYKLLDLPDIADEIKSTVLYSQNISFINQLFKDDIFLSKIPPFKNAWSFIKFLENVSDMDYFNELHSVKEFLITRIFNSKIGNLNITFGQFLRKFYEIDPASIASEFIRWLEII